MAEINNYVRNSLYATKNVQIPQAYGAIGDGVSRPLSSVYANLAAAQAVYPFATALTDEIDWCGIQMAINIAETTTSGGHIMVPNTGAEYRLNKSLTINPKRAKAEGNGATLGFHSLPADGIAIRFKGDAGPQYYHEARPFQGFEMIGPGSFMGAGRGTSAALFFETNTSPMSSASFIRDLAIRDFGDGMRWGDRGYITRFSNVGISYCDNALHYPWGVAEFTPLFDAGEQLSFSQCNFFNCGVALRAPGGGGFRWFGCTVDYNGAVMADCNTDLEAHGCWIEFLPSATVPFDAGGSRVKIIGGFIQVNGDIANFTAPAMFSAWASYASIMLIGVRGYKWQPTSNQLFTGAGKLYVSPVIDISNAAGSVGAPGALLTGGTPIYFE